MPLVSPGVMSYCITDFGNSDTWFLGNPTVYDASHDVLSGDDALGLSYRGQGFSWVSPYLDQGTLNPQSVPSDFSVTSPLTYTAGNSAAQSVVQDTNGIQITIDSSVAANVFTETLTIKNTSANNYVAFTLYDYFNFHPNGSANPASTQFGVTSIQGGCVVTMGNMSQPGFISDGRMCGSAAPNTQEVGYAQNSNPSGGTPIVWQNVAAETLNGSSGPTAPGDTAGALGWNLGDLNAGATTTFTITKDLFATPEPGTLVMGIGAALLLLGLRRKQRV
jgi:hypothetical protein